MRHLAFGTAALALVAGCTADNPTYSSFYREAGAVRSDSAFGTSVIDNYNVHSGAADYRINLARRFEAEVATTINFAFDSHALDDAARAVLRQQADWIRQFPEVRFTVYGHTDLVGSAAYNQRLGLRRAEAAVLYLVSQGIDRSRLDAVVSRGQTQPLVVTEGRERRNRRTVTEVSGFVGSHPSVLNGRYAEIIFRDYVASAVPPSTLTGISGAEFATAE